MGAYLLIVFAVLSRVIPHSWMNFTAVGGGLLYFGARRPLREAIWPVLALMATDVYLTIAFYHYPWHTSAYLITWAWYAAVIVLGRIILKDHITVSRVISAPVIASTSFFLISNYAVWVMASGPSPAAGSMHYAHTLAGLGACYAAGLPFYRNDVLSTMLVTGLAFGLPILAHRLAEQRAHSKLAA
ncbi:MAG TPA: DUF6580 family putative transport protein [Acidobacteriaceae bacterium]|nr:DUF6580 family putative transport protein [Acidobacteriaceae bacterium]